jgi:hypothetical protein
LAVLEDRRGHGACLQEFVIRSCGMLDFGYRTKLRELVKKVLWSNMTLLDPVCDETDDGPNIDELGYSDA